MTRPPLPCVISHDEISPFIALKCGQISRIDEIDVEAVRPWNWVAHAHKNGPYVRRHHYRTFIRLHRAIMDAPDDMCVDHINGDTLDNRRQNLRICTLQQNAWNRRPNTRSFSGLKGVSFRQGKWISAIRINGIRRHIGTYDDKTTAALSYDRAAKLHFGDFAFLNFPEVLR